MPDICKALEAMALRAAREARAAAPTAPADDVIADMALLQEWQPGKYAIGDVRVHAGQPWRCCQAHDSTSNEIWAPGAHSAGTAPGAHIMPHRLSGHCLGWRPPVPTMPTRRASI